PPDGGGHVFEFSSCAAAVEACWSRRQQMADIAAAIETAKLEFLGLAADDRDDRIAGGLDDAPIDPEDAALFPDYLVCLEADGLEPEEQAALMDALSNGLPVRVLLVTHDVLDTPALGSTHFGFGAMVRQMTGAALGTSEVFVLQTPGSLLLKSVPAIRRALRYDGASLIAVFSGASAHTGDLPPYLVAAAALESRAFPAFVYDPAEGADQAARLSLQGNPQRDRDWPVHRLDYETADHRAASTDASFTLVDF